MRSVFPVLAFVAGPYRDSRGPYYIRENIRAAEKVSLHLWQEGFPAICPHLNTCLWDGAAPDEVWLQGDIEILSRCDVVVCVPGWQRSSGTTNEVEFALMRNIPVLEFESPSFWLDMVQLAREKEEATG
jgi:nucleoside 2-deoxyribosyltransferase